MVLTLKKDLKLLMIVTDPILQERCIIFRIQITLLLVSFSCNLTLEYSVFLNLKLVVVFVGLSAYSFATIANFQWFSKYHHH